MGSRVGELRGDPIGNPARQAAAEGTGQDCMAGVGTAQRGQACRTDGRLAGGKEGRTDLDGIRTQR